MILKIKIISFSLLLLSNIGCEENRNFKTIEFESFKMTVPSTWTKKVFKGIDYKAEFLYTETGDTIHIDYGNQNGLFDYTVQVFSKDQIRKYDSIGLDTKKLVYSKTPALDESQGIYLKEYYYYDTISGFKAKIKIPKRNQKGILGVSFDSISKDNKKLKIFAQNINQRVSDELIRAIKTITIKTTH